MNNLKKVRDALSLVLSTASAVVALGELWKKVGPEVKKVVKPVFEDCKKIVSDLPSSNSNICIK